LEDLKDKEKISLTGGLADEHLRKKLLRIISQNISEVNFYRVERRLKDMDGLFLKME
jgi:hypothetical protein